MTRSTRLLSLVALAASAGLGACSDDTGPQNSPITARETQAIGAAAAQTADLAVTALTPSIPDFGGGVLTLFANGRSAPAGLQLSPPDSLPNCPAASDLTDTDGDGVPDDAVWTFNAADCTQVDEDGNRGVVTGSVGLTDPGLTAGYDLDITGLTAQYYTAGAVTPLAQLNLDGTWALRGTSDALSLQQDYAWGLMLDGHTASLTNQLAVAFAVAEGGAIAWGVPLPDGTIEITGDWRVTTEEGSHHLTLTTTAPLVYDAACGGIVGGTLVAVGDGGEVTVTWTACRVHTAGFSEE